MIGKIDWGKLMARPEYNVTTVDMRGRLGKGDKDDKTGTK